MCLTRSLAECKTIIVGTTMAAFCRNHKSGGSAFARSTYVVHFFVLVLNRMNVVARTHRGTDERTAFPIWSTLARTSSVSGSNLQYLLNAFEEYHQVSCTLTWTCRWQCIGGRSESRSTLICIRLAQCIHGGPTYTVPWN